jgi:cytidine deaminase
MSIDDEQLVASAHEVCGEFALRDDFSAGSVGAALVTAGGNLFTGICIDLGCGLGFCAEVSAIAEMLKARETRIAAIVAVSRHGIIPPCGRCRETMAQLDPANLDCRVIVGEGRSVPLRELLPLDWLGEAEAARH